MAMRGPKPESEDDEVVCEFLDFSRAHFHAPTERKVLVRIDSEVYNLVRTMYGLQDAGAALDKMRCEEAKKMGCQLGTFTNCVLSRVNLEAQRYGDDYAVLVHDVR